MERGKCSKGELKYFQRCVQKPCMQFFKYHMAYSVIILVGLRPPGICKIRFCGDLNWIDDDPFSINRNFHQSRKLSFPSSLPILLFLSFLLLWTTPQSPFPSSLTCLSLSVLLSFPSSSEEFRIESTTYK